MTPDTKPQHDYDIALSFAGEDRQAAEALVEALKRRGISVFYDKDEQAVLWGKDLYEYLADLYTNKARFCVMFLSAHYAKKMWTNHERRNAQARAFRESREYILPLRLDDTEIPGVVATVGYLDLRHTSIEAVADNLQTKLGKLPQSAMPAAANQAAPARKPRVVPMPAIPHTWSDFERDQYLEETFGVVRDYFAEGAAQLEAQLPGVKVKITPIHARKFVCGVYRDGKRLGECKIWVGGPMFRDAISYVDGRFTNDDDSSLNDYVSIDDSGPELRLKLSGIALGSWRPSSDVVTAEVAAEYLWRRFTQPLNR